MTHEVIVELRKTHQLKVVQGLDLYAKRSMIRNLNHTSRFNKEELLFLCDEFFSVQYYGRQEQNKKSSDRMDMDHFVLFLGRVADWANTKKDMDEQQSRLGADAALKPIVGSSLVEKLFRRCFDKDGDGFCNFQDIVTGLGQLIHSDMMSRLNLFFELHDSDNDGFLIKDEVIQLSESLLFLLRREEGDEARHLGAVSGLLNRAFMLHAQANDEGVAVTDEAIRISVSTFRELVLGDEYLVDYFEKGFPSTFVFKAKEQVQVITAPVVGKEIVESIWSGGLKWMGGKRVPPIPSDGQKQDKLEEGGSPVDAEDEEDREEMEEDQELLDEGK